MHQNPIDQMEVALEATGEARQGQRSGEAGPTAGGDERSGTDDPMNLMDRIVERRNLARALKRVRQNQGSAGSDGMTVGELGPYLQQHWERVREELLTGRYQPSAVRQHAIPKGDGRMRTLGIPTVLDRFIQQAVLQVLQPQFDPTFSESSYGFRPGRRAHDAVCQAQRYVQSGRRWVVDVDLEQFFDRVNHDVLMGKLSQRITDRRVLVLIRRYLAAGIMAHGVVQERYEGTPQGGPLSPLLANVLLDEVDKELERRGHRFVRYADDCNVYLRSQRAGKRVMEALVGLYAKLKLRVNLESFRATWSAGERTSSSPTRLAFSRRWISGFIDECGCSCSNSGSGDERCITSCNVVVLRALRSASPLVSAEAGGTWPHTKRSRLLCRAPTSTRSESRVLPNANLNSPNRRMRTRMSGGVGGK